jgi:hypothetical protein
MTRYRSWDGTGSDLTHTLTLTLTLTRTLTHTLTLTHTPHHITRTHTNHSHILTYPSTVLLFLFSDASRTSATVPQSGAQVPPLPETPRTL